MAEFNPNFLTNADVGWTGTNGRYFPPDFDPSKLQGLGKIKGLKGPKQMNMRMIMPFSMYCESCGECMYIGTKFNSKCEPVKGEEHLGIRIFRFYGRCKNCMHEFIFKTDPGGMDYILERGGSRSYEAWRDADAADQDVREKIEEEKKDKMKELEHKTYDIQEEMRRMDQLDDLMKMNKRMKATDAPNAVLDAWRERQAASPSPAASPASPSDDLDEDEMAELDEFLTAKAAREETQAKEPVPAPAKFGAPEEAKLVDGVATLTRKEPPKPKRVSALVVRKRPAGSPGPAKAAKTEPEPPAGGGLGLGSYASDDSS